MTSNEPEAPAATVELDAEGKALQLAAEKAKYVESIAKARSGSIGARSALLTSLTPAVDDAPKGEVNLGANAGAFGPWAAHRLLDAVASRIATATGLTGDSRVLVVSNRLLQPKDWTAQEVGNVLQRLSNTANSATFDTRAAAAAFETASSTMAPESAGKREPDTRRTSPSTRGATSEPASGDSLTAATSASSGGGAFTAAVNLIGLLRTDYTVTSAQTTSGETELATLVAGRLAATTVVEADSFTTMSPLSKPQTDASEKASGKSGSGAGVRGALLDLQQELELLLSLVTGLQAQIAPLESGIAELTHRVRSLEAVWASAVTDGKETGALTQLQDQIATLNSRLAVWERAVAPVRIHLARAQQVVAEVDAVLAAMMRPAAPGAEPAFLTAVRLEVLHDKINERQITHVLYVNLDSLGSDAVTRRSVLGTSGRIQFLVGSTASWLLLDARDGRIGRGGQVSLADAMSFDLATGSTNGLEKNQWEALNNTEGLQTAPAASGAAPSSHWQARKLPTDPLSESEKWAKILVSVMVVALLLIGAFSFVAVLLSVVK